MANPYRTRMEGSPPVRSPGDRLGAATLVFGFVCAVLGEALGGAGCALVATLAGALLLLSPGAYTRRQTQNAHGGARRQGE